MTTPTSRLDTIKNMANEKKQEFAKYIAEGNKNFTEANKIFATLDNFKAISDEPKYSIKATTYGYKQGPLYRNYPNIGNIEQLTTALTKLGEGFNAFSKAEIILIDFDSYKKDEVNKNQIYENLTKYFEDLEEQSKTSRAVATSSAIGDAAQGATTTAAEREPEDGEPEDGASGTTTPAGGGKKKNNKKNDDKRKKKYRGGANPNFAIDLPGFENVGGLLNNASPYDTALSSISAMTAPQSYDAGFPLSTSSSAGLPTMYRAVSDGGVTQSGGKSKNKDKKKDKKQRGGDYLDANAKSYELISNGMENVAMNGGKNKNKDKKSKK